jgi:hypothetical protein
MSIIAYWVTSCFVRLFPLLQPDLVIGMSYSVGHEKHHNLPSFSWSQMHFLFDHLSAFSVCRLIRQTLDPSKRLPSPDVERSAGSVSNKTNQMKWPAYFVQILDLVDSLHDNKGKRWTLVGNISSNQQNASRFSQKMLGHDFVDKATTTRQRFRVVTSTSPPFVQESTRMMNGTCLTGVRCLRVRSHAVGVK